MPQTAAQPGGNVDKQSKVTEPDRVPMEVAPEQQPVVILARVTKINLTAVRRGKGWDKVAKSFELTRLGQR
jgi:hypothetical protein